SNRTLLLSPTITSLKITLSHNLLTTFRPPYSTHCHCACAAQGARSAAIAGPLCPSDTTVLNSASQCRLTVPVSAAYQRSLSVPYISVMYQCCLSVPISDACQCPSV
ncbi:unnamed protein product, partial [Staurois parvus]